MDDVDSDLTEPQLRQLYDDEEIQRFLHLFAAYVTEVRQPEVSVHDAKSVDASNGSLDDVNQNALVDESGDETESSDWISSTGIPLSPPSKASSFPQSQNRSFAEEIALRYVVPALGPAPLPPPMFTLDRLRLTAQRLYLSAQPVYGPFFSHLAKLAAWEDRKQSTVYCTIFWILWYHNLILPSLILRVLFAMIRRKLLPHPTLAELQRHRREVIRASEFGDQISYMLTVSSTFGMKEMWQLIKVLKQTRPTKSKIPGVNVLHEDNGAQSSLDIEDVRHSETMKSLILRTINELADLHERVKNIFIWRSPALSRIYCVLILILFLVTLTLPARYLAKLTYFIGGFIFWHVTPIIAALPATERARLPPAFKEIPTDAEYAMELISQRIAAGLDIEPIRTRRDQRTRGTTTGEEIPPHPRELNFTNKKADKNVDWKKWGDRAAVGKAIVNDGKRLFNKEKWPQSQLSPPNDTVLLPRDSAIEHVETHTFPAQHSSSPGLITITPTTFFFTPVMSLNAKTIISLAEIQGVKKTGLLKGINICWISTSDKQRIEKVEKFKWVGGRDELFARLIAAGGRQWMKV